MTESDERSRFYILTLVCHDQSVSIEAAEKALVHDLATFGIVNLCFHAGPVIHANDQFEFLSWDLRRRIFTRMMGFVRRIKFGYRCIVIDKKYANTKEQIQIRSSEGLLRLWAEGNSSSATSSNASSSSKSNPSPIPHPPSLPFSSLIPPFPCAPSKVLLRSESTNAAQRDGLGWVVWTHDLQN